MKDKQLKPILIAYTTLICQPNRGQNQQTANYVWIQKMPWQNVFKLQNPESVRRNDVLAPAYSLLQRCRWSRHRVILRCLTACVRQPYFDSVINRETIVLALDLYCILYSVKPFIQTRGGV